MSTFDIYAIGNALVDTEIDVTDDDLKSFGVQKGLMTLVDEERQNELIEQLSGHLVQAKRASGGSAANTIIGASYFGSKGFYSCKVANDENGEFYLNDLEKANVGFCKNNDHVSGITGKCLVMITNDAERTMNTFLGVSDRLSANDIDEDALANSEFAYIEGYLVTSDTAKAAAISLREKAQSNGVKVAVSLSDPALAEHFRDGLGEIIGDKIYLLFCNQDEALAFTQTDSLDAACAKLSEISENIAITCGSDGALICHNGEQIRAGGVKADAVDTNGAGDMFAGAFLHAICTGHSFRVAAEFSNRAAAKVVSQYGPRLKADEYQALLPIER